MIQHCYLNLKGEVFTLPDGERLPFLTTPQDEISATASLKKILTWVASEAVISTAIHLPRAASTVESIGYALEEQLIEPLEQYHLIRADRSAQNLHRMFIVSCKQMALWQQALKFARFSPQQIFADFLALPYASGKWTLFVDRHRVLVRYGMFEGLAGPPERIWPWLERAAIEIRNLHIFSDESARLPASYRALAESMSWWQILANAPPPPRTTNLSQGKFAIIRGQAHGYSRLRPALITLLLVMLLLGISDGLRLRGMIDETMQYRNTVANLYQQMFPGALRPRDSKLQTQFAEQVIRLRQRAETLTNNNQNWRRLQKMAQILTRCKFCSIEEIFLDDTQLHLVMVTYQSQNLALREFFVDAFGASSISWSVEENLLGDALQYRIMVGLTN